MRNSKAKLAAILLLALPLLAQTDGGKPATVSGTVTNSVSGVPVPRAHVTLQGESNDKQVRYGATSAADGRFSFTGVAPGFYLANAERVGFDGSRGTPRDRLQITLKAGDARSGLDVRLTPTGSIAGRVTDSSGEPVESAYVIAQGSRGGGSGTTDETGQFRIGGLPPGKYSVRAGAGGILGPPPEIRTDGTVEVHDANTYYPGVLTEKEAGKVDVRPAVESGGVDIRLVAVPFVRISGKAIDLPANAGQVSIEVSQGGSGNGTGMRADGVFRLWMSNPGKYTLRARWNVNGQTVHTVPVPIDVAGSNIDNLELRVVPDSDVSGRLDFEDDEARRIPHEEGPDAETPERTVTLVALTGDEDGAAGSIAADGTFSLKKVPAGTYRVQASWGNAYIKSMRLGTAVFDGAVLDLRNGSGGADLSLLMSAAASSVSGTVHRTGHEKDLNVILLPAESMSGFEPRITGIDEQGAYAFAHVPPGKYRLLAIPEDELAIQDDNVPGYENQMEDIQLGVRDKVTKDLKPAFDFCAVDLIPAIQLEVGTFSA